MGVGGGGNERYDRERLAVSVCSEIATGDTPKDGSHSIRRTQAGESVPLSSGSHISMRSEPQDLGVSSIRRTQAGESVPLSSSSQIATRSAPQDLGLSIICYTHVTMVTISSGYIMSVSAASKQHGLSIIRNNHLRTSLT